MVARLTQILRWEDVWRFSQPLTADPPKDNLRPRYNLAPTDDVLIVRFVNGRREPARVRWGLIPGWAKDASGAAKCINARAETVERLPSFRDAFAKRRCLVPVSGFYEWQTSARGEKTPYYITLANGEPMALAGLWSSWMPRRGPAVETCSIVTTAPNSLVAAFHSRMPVVLDQRDFDRWLGEISATTDDLKALLKAYPSEQMQAWPVDMRVGSPKWDEPQAIVPLERATTTIPD